MPTNPISRPPARCGRVPPATQRTSPAPTWAAERPAATVGRMAVQALEGSDSACLERDCPATGSGIDGRCLAHISEEALEQLRSHCGMPVDLDGRGARFDQRSLKRLLDAIFSGSEGGCLGTVRFEGATFESLVHFDGAVFIGPVSFAGSTFLGDARFGGAVFSAETSFDGAAFKGQAWFVEGVFLGPVSFRGAAFSGPAWFQGTEFQAPARFDAATFAENASFVSARVLSAWSFARASFRSHALFDTSARTEAKAWEGASFGHEGEAPSAACPVPTSLASAGAIDGLAPSRPTRSRARRRRLHASSLIPLLILAVLALTYFVILRPDGGAVVDSASPDIIPRGRPDAFAFSSIDAAGRPARFNPCRPVRYVVNPAGAPSYWRDSLNEALAEVGSATGLSFEEAGAITNESAVPQNVNSALYLKDLKRDSSLGRLLFQPSRYGQQEWAPILVQWADFGRRTEGLNSVGLNEFAGLTNEDGNVVLVSGVVVIAEKLSRSEQKFVLMHEFAHLVGLDHVDDTNQLLAAAHTSPRLTWGAGDRAGLQKVGKEAGCLKTPAPS